MTLIEKVLTIVISFCFLMMLSWMAVEAAATGTADAVDCYLLVLACSIVWGIIFTWTLNHKTEDLR